MNAETFEQSLFVSLPLHLLQNSSLVNNESHHLGEVVTNFNMYHRDGAGALMNGNCSTSPAVNPSILCGALHRVQLTAWEFSPKSSRFLWS